MSSIHLFLLLCLLIRPSYCLCHPVVACLSCCFAEPGVDWSELSHGWCSDDLPLPRTTTTTTPTAYYNLQVRLLPCSPSHISYFVVICHALHAARLCIGMCSSFSPFCCFAAATEMKHPIQNAATDLTFSIDSCSKMTIPL